MESAAALLQVERLLQHRPKAMSGGQKQRIAIGRAIVRKPDVFLFDEPLSNLDAILRVEIRSQITKLHRKLSATMIFVTHDQVEAMTMADRIVVLNNGHIEQMGTPRDIYHRPANLFVARFVGSPPMNILEGVVVARTQTELHVDVARRILHIPGVFADVARGTKISLGIRPERLRLSPPTAALLKGEVTLVEHLGGETLLQVQTSNEIALAIKCPGDSEAAVGDEVGLECNFAGASVFGLDSQNLLLRNQRVVR